MYKTIIVYFILLISALMQSYGGYSLHLEKNETLLYQEAIKLFNQNKYKRAIKIFQKIEDLYPFSSWAIKAKLLSGISYYNIGNYKSAASSMENYIHIYSNTENLPYVLYLRVLSYYMQVNKVQFDQQLTYKALELANSYINLFPNSKYTNEIKEKVKLIKEHISANEYSIGKFYLMRGEYLSAIKRFQNIISTENSVYFSRSISHLVEACLALSLDLEAHQYKNILVKTSNEKEKTL